jgi:hypothetical protein
MYQVALNMPATVSIIMGLLKAWAWLLGAFCAVTHGHTAVMILR